MRKPRGKLRVALGLAGDGLWNLYILRVDEDGDWISYEVDIDTFDSTVQARRTGEEIAKILGVDLYWEPHAFQSIGAGLGCGCGHPAGHHTHEIKR